VSWKIGSLSGDGLGARDRKMPFSEGLKLQVRKMAAFRCCRCHEIGVDIHHIIPQAQGGTDDIDNAAPLCQNCHNRFGANAEKRKQIRGDEELLVRSTCKKNIMGTSLNLKKINETILKILRTQESSQAEMENLRKELIDEIRALRPIQEQAVEDLNTVSVEDLPRQANTAISANIAGSPEGQMDRNRWKRVVTDKLNRLAPDEEAIKGWVRSQGFTIDSAGKLSTGGWWFSAENQQMTFSKLTVRWDENKTPQLSVEV
jgi:HNH endonuclease